MTKYFLLAAGVVAGTLWGAPVAAQSPAAGHWEGEIQMPDQVLRLSIDLAPNAGGVWIGSLSIPPTTTVDVPITDIVVGGQTVKFAVQLPGATSFDATLSADGQSMSGSVANALGAVPFQVARKGEPNVKVPPPSSPLTKDFEGSWVGTIDAGGRLMRIALTLANGPNGTGTATLVNLDQANQPIPITSVLLKGRDLLLDARVISGTYRGTLNDAGEIVGVWAQGPGKAPLTFKRGTP